LCVLDDACETPLNSHVISKKSPVILKTNLTLPALNPLISQPDIDVLQPAAERLFFVCLSN
jgi:hypothetical protein